MSGISGVLGSGEDPLPLMVEKLSHRGPDGQITFKRGQVTLGLDWLEIPGQEAQLLTTWKDRAIIMDGYLTNYQELAEEVGLGPGEGQELLVLRLFEAYGHDALAKLQGMFALAITDGEQLVLARDPIGIKPLYYGIEGKGFYFASEAKALAFLTDSFKEFPPGCYYDSQLGWGRVNNPVQPRQLNGISVGEAQERVADLLKKGVEQVLADGAPVGVLLSGGLDSSLVAALAVETNGGSLPSFAVGAEGSSDLVKARQVAEYLGTEHHEYIYDQKDIEECLPQVVYYLESFDAEMIPPSFGNYLVSRLAADQGVKVVLSGEGADELFAGYAYMKELAAPGEVQQECNTLLKNLHNVSCQRVDRMNAAHSVDVRVPFLEQEMMEFAMGLPVEWKLYGEEKIEKWILRQAFSEGDYLPEDIIWRQKSLFQRGCGSSGILGQYAQEQVSEAEYRRRKEKTNGSLVRSREEYYYYQIFKEFYPHHGVEETMGRWSMEKVT